MSRWKRIFIKFLSLLNIVEGYIHIIVAIVGFWGMYDTGFWDWRIFVAPAENLIFGVFSLLTGLVLKEFHHKH